MLKQFLIIGLALVSFQAGFTATVSGKVTAATGGAAIADAKVIMRGLRGGNLGGDTATTNAQGNYSFADVENGRYILTASKTGFQQETASIQVMAAANVTQNFALAGQIGTGGRTGKVVGTVRIARTEKPIANATVRWVAGLAGGLEGDSTKSDAQGKYTLDSVSTRGAIITATAAGYSPGFETAQLVAGGIDTVNFNLTPIVSGLRETLAAKGMTWSMDGKRLLLRRSTALQPVRLRAQLASGKVVAESLLPAGSHEAALDLGSAAGAVFLSLDGELMGALR